MSVDIEPIRPPCIPAGIARLALLMRTLLRINWREIMFRAAAVTATGAFVLRASYAFGAHPERISLLLVVLSESLTAALLLVSSTPKVRDTHLFALLCVIWAYAYSALLSVSPGLNLISPLAGTVVCSAGVVLTIWGKMVIGRSFGLLPATRELVRTGPYRFVRHPIYVGYFITHLGFILSDFTTRNLIVLAALYMGQIVRVLREERTLGQEPAYRAYCKAVPYRFCYGLI